MKLQRDVLYSIVIVALIAICGQFYYDYRYKPAHQISVYYNQDVEANNKIAGVIRDADRYVYFAIYTFTRSDIKDAILGAKHRGLDVQGVVDKEQTDQIEEQGKIVAELRTAGIPITLDTHSGIMHLKTIVTDKAYASGSYNWTTSATTTNDEVLEIGTEPSVQAQYYRVIRELFKRNGAP